MTYATLLYDCSTCDEFNGSALSAQLSTAKWFTIDQIGNKLKLDGTLQDVSACSMIFSSLSSGFAPYLINLTQQELSV